MLEDLAGTIAEFVNGTLGPIANYLEKYVWGWPEQAPLLAVILLGTGLFVTVRLMFIQVRGFKHAIDITRGTQRSFANNLSRRKSWRDDK